MALDALEYLVTTTVFTGSPFSVLTIALVALARLARRRSAWLGPSGQHFDPAPLLTFLAVASALPLAVVFGSVLVWSLLGIGTPVVAALPAVTLAAGTMGTATGLVVWWTVRTPRNLNPLAAGRAVVATVMPTELGRGQARKAELPGRNEPCLCGSGRKYKRCHGAPAGVVRG